MTAEPGQVQSEGGEADDGGLDGRAEPRVSRAAAVWSALAAFALTAWFFFAWLVLDRMMLDAAGEAIGTGLLLLLLVSIVNALMRSRSGD